MKALAFLAAAAFAFPAVAAPVHHRPAPAHAAHPAARPPVLRDWTRIVVATPEGGFRMGNPSARVKLVEYGSLTCPHCAAFAREGETALVQNYVKAGRVSYEYRNYVLNGIDVVASLLARCSGPSGFFPMAQTLYATQQEWIGRISGLPQAQKDQLKAMPEAQRLVRLGELGGLTQVAARYGVAPARARQCLADKAGLDRLGKMVEAAGAMGVDSTPTFFINGVNANANTWSAIEPLIRNAGG
jgi:protein-disulfide isomerase